MTPEQQRQRAAQTVLRAFRPAQVAMDNASHVDRELKFSQWFIRNPFLTLEVAGLIDSIGMRKEWWP